MPYALFSHQQKTFTKVFMQYSDAYIQRIVEIRTTNEQGFLPIDDILNTSTQVIETIGAVAMLVGIGAAGISFGTSMAAAGAVITLAQLVKCIAEKIEEAQSNPYTPSATERDTEALSLHVLLHEVSDLINVRYRSLVDVRLTEQGVWELSKFCARRIMKKVLLELNQGRSVHDLHSRDLVDYLLSSIKLPMMHGAEHITFKSPYAPSHSLLLSEIYDAKSACAKARPACYVFSSDSRVELSFYHSKNEDYAFTRKKTLLQYGYMTVPLLHLHSTTAAVTNLTPLDDSMIDIEQIKKELCVNYPITKAQLGDYLTEIRSNEDKLSLNEWLFRRVGIEVVACTFNETTGENLDLSGIDLSYGNFSEVNFRRVNLSNCNLSNTHWQDARLTHAIFAENDLTQANFQGAYLEFSQWTNVVLKGAFIQTKMTRAQLTHCAISHHEFLDIDSDWRMCMGFDQITILNEIEQLTAEVTILKNQYSEQCQLRQELKGLTDQYSLIQDRLQQSTYTQEALRDYYDNIQALRTNLLSIEERFESKFTMIHAEFSQIHHQYDLMSAALDESHHQHEQAIQEIERLRREQMARWVEQDKFNQRISRKLQALDPHSEEVLLAHLKHYWDKDLNTVNFQHICNNYIELYVTCADPSNNRTTLLSDELQNFLTSKNFAMLLMGEVGAGKSLSALLWVKKLMHDFRSRENWLPIYIKLKLVSPNSTEPFIEACLKTLNLTEAMIETLKANFNCIFIFDGLDECEIIEKRHIMKECAQLDDSWENNYKFLLLGQERYFHAKDHRTLLQLPSGLKFPPALEFSMCPLNVQQGLEYRKLCANEDPHFEERFNELEQREKEMIKFMSRSPLMYRIVCEVLCALPATDSLPNTRFAFYDGFYRNWFRHVQQKFPSHEDNYTYTGFLNYIQELAMKMYIAGRSSIEVKRHIEHRDAIQTALERIKEQHLNLLCEFFENPLLERTNFLTPLSMKIQRQNSMMLYEFEFSHPSLGDFALASSLLNILLAPTIPPEEKFSAWNHRFLTQTPSVFEFLQEQIITLENLVDSVTEENISPCSEARKILTTQLQLRHLNTNHPLYQLAETLPQLHQLDNLLHIRKYIEHVLLTMLSNAQNADYAKAGSNAITCLRYLKFVFSRSCPNLSNLHFPYADLRNAYLAFTTVHGSDVTGSLFNHAVLLGSDFTGSDCRDARFQDADSSMKTQKTPQTFAMYPSQVEKIVAYDIKNKKHSILIERLSDGHIYHQLDGHSDTINALRWFIHSGNAYLASAGQGKTIRLWEFPSGNQIAKLKGHQSVILNLASSSNGIYLAAAMEDQAIEIWHTLLKRSVYLYIPSTQHRADVHYLYWTRSNLLISAGPNDVAGVQSAIRWWMLKPEETHILEAQEPPIVQILAGNISCMTLSSDEKLLAIGFNEKKVVIFAVPEEPRQLVNYPLQPLHELNALCEAPQVMHWKGSRLIIAGRDGKIQIWNTREWICTAILEGHTNRFNTIEGLPTETEVITGGGGIESTFLIWKTQQTANVKFHTGHRVMLTQTACWRHKVASGDKHGYILLWDIKQLQKKSVQKIANLRNSSIRALSWTSDGHYLAILSTHHQLIIYDSHHQTTLNIEALPGTARINHCAWLTTGVDALQLIIGATDGLLYLLSVTSIQSATIRTSFGSNLGAIQCVASAHHSLHLACAAGPFVTIWHVLEKPTAITQFNLTHTINHLAWAPNDRFLAVIDDNYQISIWEIATLKCIKKLPAISSQVSIKWIVFQGQIYFTISTPAHIKIFNVSQGWNSQIFHSFGADSIDFTSSYLLCTRHRGIHLFDFSELLRQKPSFSPWIDVLGHSGWLQQLNLADVCNLSPASRRYVDDHEGIVSQEAINTTSTWFGFGKSDEKISLPSPTVNYQALTRSSPSYGRLFSSHEGSAIIEPATVVGSSLGTPTAMATNE